MKKNKFLDKAPIEKVSVSNLNKIVSVKKKVRQNLNLF